MAITKTYELLNVNGVKGWIRDSWARRQIATINTALAGKADTLDSSQMAAVNSGITAAIISDYEARITALEARVAALEGSTT